MPSEPTWVGGWEDLKEWAQRNYDHLKRCSCWMCGNPRKYGAGPPVQEQRLLAAADEEAELE